MPLYEYECRQCGHRFEALVRASETPACPACQSADLERAISSFAVSSAERSRSALHAARRAFTNDKNRHEQLNHEREETVEHLREDYGLDDFGRTAPKPGKTGGTP
jgi:putative FmdB family regulatory protein